MLMNERTIHMERVYDGRIVALELHDVEMHHGVRAKREVIRHGPAVAVVAETQDGRFALVRQFRKPVECAMLEVVAGNVEPGEPLETSARREVREETGYEVETIRRLGAIYTSPGYVDERIELYHARLAAQPAAKAMDEDEHVELAIYSREEVRELIVSGKIQDGKTLSAWLLYERMPEAESSEKAP